MADTTDRHDNVSAFYSKPSRLTRFWWWLGFHKASDPALWEWRSADPAPDDWWVPGAFSTETFVKFGFGDRIRILFSGAISVSVASRTDVLVRRSEARASISVLAPGAPSRG